MSDYRWNFPTSGLALALDGLAALRAELGPAALLSALGDPRDEAGDIVTPDMTKPARVTIAWIGRPGSAAATRAGIDGKNVAIPAKGDPSKYYMHIRTDADAPGFNPAAYSLSPTDPAESAAVLGVWAGDTAP